MPSVDSADLKRKLRAEGFEIYRTRGSEVVLAERVRDNLIMDSGVAVQLPGEGKEFGVLVIVRAQAIHFPGASPEQVLGHAVQLASEFVSAGYARGEPVNRVTQDPGNPERTLDTSYEIPLTRSLSSESELFAELRRALGMVRSSTDD